MFIIVNDLRKILKKWTMIVSEKIKLFDFLKALTSEKIDYTDDPRFERDYQPYIINQFLSMELTTLPVIDYVSQFPDMPKKMHFKFLFHFLDATSVYIKYVKKAKSPNADEVNIIMDYFGVSENIAKYYYDILSDENINKLKELSGLENDNEQDRD